jgi:phosphate transport system protein
MSHQFDEGLSQLKGQLFAMASLAEQQIGKAVKALVDRDAALAEQVRKDDAGINQLEVDIENTCLSLLARFQPEARDLRFIAMIFKIVNDLERVGDQAVNISERTVDLLKEPLLKPLIDIPKIAQLAQQMLKDSLDAFVAQDAELARTVCRNDDQVDQLNDQIQQELLEHMLKDPQTVTRALDLIFISSNLERVADHATNIAEDVYYLVKGSTIKHRLAGI